MVTPLFFIHVLVRDLQNSRYPLRDFRDPVVPQRNIQFLQIEMFPYLPTGLLKIRLLNVLPNDDELIATEAENLAAMAVFK